MTTWILIMFGAVLVLALWHFIYDGILSPTLRLAVRYRLFAVRDELRSLRYREPALGAECFELFHDYINTAIELVPALSISLISEAERALRDDPQLRHRIEERVRVMDSCSVPGAQEIRHKAFLLARQALIINAGSWLIWLVPIALILHLIRSIPKLLAVPAREIANVAPASFRPAGLAAA